MENPEQERGEAQEAGALQPLPSRAGLRCVWMQTSVRKAVLAPCWAPAELFNYFLANWIQEVGKSSSPSLCPPFTLPTCFPVSGFIPDHLAPGEQEHLFGDPFSAAAQSWAVFFFPR